MSRLVVHVLGLRALARRDGVSDRAVVLALFGRFVDEMAGGLVIVLMPTLQRRLGLTVTQVGWCLQAIYGAGAVVEPVAAAAIDVMRRRALLVWGAAGWSVALLLVAGAPTYLWLLAACALIGVSSGPLAHTTDVLLVEMHPSAEERIGTRQTMLDTVGALLAPTAVAVVGWSGGDVRLPLVLSGIAILGYAALLAVTPMLDPPAQDGASGTPIRRAWRRIRTNMSDVLRTREALVWLIVLLGEALMDVWWLFTPVWLAGDVGASQAAIAVHAAVELVASLIGLFLVDRWLRRYDARAILTVACLSGMAAFVAWLLVPGIVAKTALVIPLTLAVTPVWPLARARALAAVPGRGGALLAVMSLSGALPLAALVGWVGDRIGLAPTMFAMHLLATVLILVPLRRRWRPSTARGQ